MIWFFDLIFAWIDLRCFLRFCGITISDRSGGILSSGWASRSKSPDDWGRMDLCYFFRDINKQEGWFSTRFNIRRLGSKFAGLFFYAKSKLIIERKTHRRSRKYYVIFQQKWKLLLRIQTLLTFSLSFQKCHHHVWNIEERKRDEKYFFHFHSNHSESGTSLLGGKGCGRALLINISCTLFYKNNFMKAPRLKIAKI